MNISRCITPVVVNCLVISNEEEQNIAKLIVVSLELATIILTAIPLAYKRA